MSPANRGAVFLAVGDELLDGRVRDRHVQTAGRLLTEIGLEIKAAHIFPDDISQLVPVCQAAVSEANLLWISGGLGPTDDDKTVEMIGEAFGLDLYFDENVKAHIAAMAQAAGRESLDRHDKQTRVPKGADVWLNGAGTAPGLCLQIGDCTVVLMPGVPSEFHWLTEHHLKPLLKSRFSSPSSLEVRLRCFGLPEAGLASLLEPLVAASSDIKIQYRPSFPETTIRLTSTVHSAEEFETLTEHAKKLLGATCYGTGGASLEERVIHRLKERGEKLVVAESCTGGLLAQKLTSVPGSSQVFWGGWVTYDNDAKTKLLDVPSDLILREGAVSEPVAQAMVSGALKDMSQTWALSLTGIAGPSGGTPEKPVGTVCFGLGNADTAQAKTRQLGQWSREKIRLLSVHVALHWLRRHLET